jgi:thymidylate synthase
MTPDEKFKMLNEIRNFIKDEIKDIDLHSKPSKDTKKFIDNTNCFIKEIKEDNNKMEKKIDQIDNRLLNIENSLVEVPTKQDVIISQKEEFEKTRCMIQDMFEKHEKKSDERYAVKQVEDAVGEIKKDIKKLVWIIITAVVLALLGLVIKTNL